MIIGKLLNQYKKYNFIPATKNIIYHWNTRERRKSFGNKNPDKTFYVIRPIDFSSPFYIGAALHLLANYFYVLSHLPYAQERGWIPVVDQLNYPVYNTLQTSVYGTKNAWEYFWEQPCSYTLEEIYHSKNVVLSQQNWFSEWDMGYDVTNYINKDIVSFYHKLSQTFKLKSHIKQHIEKIFREIFPTQKRILGVSVRYVGYSRRSYYQAPGHPIAPELSALVEIVRKKCNEWNMDFIFLASDDQESISVFKAVFGEKLIFLQRARTDTSKIYDQKNVNPLYWETNIYQTSLDYLTEMELLAKCTGIIGSVTSGFRYAIVKNGNVYQNLKIIDNGCFFNPNVKVK